MKYLKTYQCKCGQWSLYKDQCSDCRDIEFDKLIGRERLNPEAFESFFPPPWNINDHPEKTKGWIEFQKEMRKDPEYYLKGCDSLNTANK